MPASEDRQFLPAAGHDLFLPLYDPISKLFGLERARKALLDQAALRPGDRVLDVGCGTGSLILQIRRSFSEVEVVGLDPDPKALARARRKTEREGGAIRLDQGFSDRLPYEDASFDRVFSSMMFHHVESDSKEATLREVRRVLKPGGSLHLLDFGGPDAASGLISRLLHSSKHLRDNSESRILEAMRQAGFPSPAVVGRRTLVFATLLYYAAAR